MLSALFARSRPRFLKAAVMVATALSWATSPATAARLWAWHYSGAQVRADGTFTTVDTADTTGGYLITGITGTRNGELIIGLQTPGTSIPGNEPYTVDDLIFPGPGPQLTSHGFGFALADGTYSNPFYADFLPTPAYLDFFSTPPHTGTSGFASSELPVQFSATPVPIPEPPAQALVFGVLALAALHRRASQRT